MANLAALDVKMPGIGAEKDGEAFLTDSFADRKYGETWELASRLGVVRYKLAGSAETEIVDEVADLTRKAENGGHGPESSGRLLDGPRVDHYHQRSVMQL